MLRSLELEYHEGSRCRDLIPYTYETRVLKLLSNLLFYIQMALDRLDTKGLIMDGFIQTVPSIEQKKLSLFETKSPNTSLRSNAGNSGKH